MAPVTMTGTSPEIFDVWLSESHWSDTTLTYSFPVDGSTYDYKATDEVTPISASQQAAVRAVLGEIASFTGLSFTEVIESPTTEGTLRFATGPSLGGAYAYLPSPAESGGDAFFGPVTDNPQIGNEAFLYFTHEIGHAMGLLHGHEYPSFVSSGFDSQEFTVVTYTDYVGDTDTYSYDSGLIDWAQSYMQLDIAALQFLYGANYATSGEIWSGDTTYAFDPTTGEMSINDTGQGIPAGNRIFRTIWDGDGTDTYDLKNYSTDLLIDLDPGGWSIFSVAQLADLNRHDSSPIYDARGNVANARLVEGDLRALIENATGGSGNDIIRGNSADNRLQGNAGDDILAGRDGSDTLLGYSGKDVLRGSKGADTILGGKGRDMLFGGGGGDSLNGGNGNDQLIGGGGKDLLDGKGGRDILTGGNGRDTMTGGGGADRFVFTSVTESALGGGSDRILDFTSTEDTLDFAALAAGVMTLALGGSFSGAGPSVITRTAGGDTEVLVDVDADSIADFRVVLVGTTSVSASDFIL